MGEQKIGITNSNDLMLIFHIYKYFLGRHNKYRKQLL